MKGNGDMALVDAPEMVIGIPQQQKAMLSNASALAKDVAKIIEENGLAKNLGGTRKHVSIEGWLTISRVNNEAPHAKVEATETHGEHEVIKARAWITDVSGGLVSEADGYCSTEEKNWKGKPFYARASMAQTRALGKAMRLRHAWVMVMAGFEATPAEEMGEEVLDAKASVKEPEKPAAPKLPTFTGLVLTVEEPKPGTWKLSAKGDDGKAVDFLSTLPEQKALAAEASKKSTRVSITYVTNSKGWNVVKSIDPILSKDEEVSA